MRDLQGNVRQILNAIGMVVANYFYDTWGNCTVTDEYGEEITDMSHIGHKNPYRWKSYYYDVDTGLYLIGSRYYNPETGRFLQSMDIAAIDENSISELIGYVNSNRYTATLAYDGFKYAVSSADTMALSLNRVLENNPLGRCVQVLAGNSQVFFDAYSVASSVADAINLILITDKVFKIQGPPLGPMQIIRTTKIREFTKEKLKKSKLDYVMMGAEILADYIQTGDESKFVLSIGYEVATCTLVWGITELALSSITGPIGFVAVAIASLLLDYLLNLVQDDIVNFFDKIIDKIF